MNCKQESRVEREKEMRRADLSLVESLRCSLEESVLEALVGLLLTALASPRSIPFAITNRLFAQ